MATVAGKQRAFRDLEVDKIDLPTTDLREEVDEEELTQLAETMKEVGVLQPILVSVHEQGQKYRLIIGGRRLRAAKKSGMPTIPSFIVDEMSERASLTTMLVENMQRSDLEPLEEARGMAEMETRFNYDEDRIAKVIGKRVDFVRDRLALLKLPPDIQAQITNGTLGVSQAVALTKLARKPEAQRAIADKAVSRGLNAAVVERMVSEVTSKKRRNTMRRKHKVKRSGEPLSENHMNAKLQQLVIQGEKLLDLVSAIPLKRWSPANAEKLNRAVAAIGQGLERFKSKAHRRSQDPQPEDESSSV